LSDYGGYDNSGYSFGANFTPFGDLGSTNECSQLQVNKNTGNPYSWQQNTTYSVLCSVIALDFVNTTGQDLSIVDLDDGSMITLLFPCALSSTSIPFFSFSFFFLFFLLSSGLLLIPYPFLPQI